MAYSRLYGKPGNGGSTHLMYDTCETIQQTNTSVGPGDYRMFKNAYVPCNNMCRPRGPQPPNPIALVDIESELKLISRIASKCEQSKYPYCNGGGDGCIMTNDPRVANYVNPYLCDRSITPTNLKPFRSSWLSDIPDDWCAPMANKSGVTFYSQF